MIPLNTQKMPYRYIIAKISAFEPLMNAVGIGALIANLLTGFLEDPKSWILVLSIVGLNCSKIYRNIKDANKE